MFLVQKDNIRNQRENVVLMIANAQSRLGIPAETDPVSAPVNQICLTFARYNLDFGFHAPFLLYYCL